MSKSKRECPSCAMMVDAKAEECPICSYEFPQQKPVTTIVAVLLLLMFLLYWIL